MGLFLYGRTMLFFVGGLNTREQYGEPSEVDRWIEAFIDGQAL